MTSWAVPGAKCVKFRKYTPPQFRHIKFLPAAVVCPIGVPLTVVGTSVHDVTGVKTVLIAEYPNVNASGVDIGWFIGNFRPLVSQADDLALFTHHLEMGEPVVVGGVSYRSLGRA